MSASRTSIGSDLAKVDAYENTSADYDELPEISSEDFARAVIRENGRPIRRADADGRVKTRVSIDLDREVVEHYRRYGEDWQAVINEELREIMSRGPARVAVRR